MVIDARKKRFFLSDEDYEHALTMFSFAGVGCY